MLSAASTVTLFWTPETLRLAQCPVITTVFETPLTLTELSLQTMVRFSLIPATLRFPPFGAVGAGVSDADGGLAFVGGTVAEAVGLAEEKLGMGAKVALPLRETWCAVKRKIAAGSAIMPMTKTPTTIHNVRLLREYWVDGLGNKPPL
jgi:hypothetical protein